MKNRFTTNGGGTERSCRQLDGRAGARPSPSGRRSRLHAAYGRDRLPPVLKQGRRNKDSSSFVSATPSAGFTLIELLAGLLAASILAITAGTMLFYAYRAWQDNLATVELQQDGTVALTAMAYAMRDATNVDISRPEQLDMLATNGVRSFFVDASSRQLYYRLNRATARAITQNRVPPQGFTYSNINNSVAVSLSLESPDGPITQSTVLHWRN